MFLLPTCDKSFLPSRAGQMTWPFLFSTNSPIVIASFVSISWLLDEMSMCRRLVGVKMSSGWLSENGRMFKDTWI